MKIILSGNDKEHGEGDDSTLDTMAREGLSKQVTSEMSSQIRLSQP